jgi:4,5-dihydroxyphthalate decarboxylase
MVVTMTNSSSFTEAPAVRFACTPYPWTLHLVGLEHHGLVGEVARASLSLEEIASGLEQGEIDAGEYSLARYVLRASRGDEGLVALPVFPFRAFRHSMLWVRDDDDGVEDPRKLAGRRVGVDRYGSTALIHLRGILQHEYGVLPRMINWVRVGEESPECVTPDDVDVVDARGADLWDLLINESVDAIAAFWKLPAFRFHRARRLFRNPRAVESAYYRKTGMYPIMHVIVLRRALYERNQAVAAVLMQALTAARRAYRSDLEEIGGSIATESPWSHLDIEFADQDGGELASPWGVEENRLSLEATLRYMREQGLVRDLLSVDDLFVAPDA